MKSLILFILLGCCNQFSFSSLIYIWHPEFLTVYCALLTFPHTVTFTNVPGFDHEHHIMNDNSHQPFLGSLSSETSLYPHPLVRIHAILPLISPCASSPSPQLPRVLPHNLVVLAGYNKAIHQVENPFLPHTIHDCG